VRCFAALTLPAPVRNHLADLARSLGGRYRIRWVAAEQIHLTLAFAGDLPDDNVDAAIDAVRNVELPPLSLSLERFGWFPPRGIPRVVWVGLGGDVDAVAAVQRDLTSRLVPLGFDRDKRGFVPHLTLGRLKSEVGALALLDDLKALDGELRPKPFAPEGLVLFRSTLFPDGPRHDVLVRTVPGTNHLP
jgi:2'-5' RNA ligase